MEIKQHATEQQMGQRRHKKRNKKYIETDENGNTTNHNICDVAKAVLRGKFIAINAYLKEQEESQTSKINLHLKKQEKEEQTNPKVSRRKEIKITV